MLPSVLSQIKKSKLNRRKLSPILTEASGFSLEEGERNNTLFQWGMLLRREEVNNESIEASLLFLNKYGVNASLGESERDGILKSVLTREVSLMRGGVGKRERMFSDIEITNQVRLQWEEIYIFVPEASEWRKWNGKYWEVQK